MSANDPGHEPGPAQHADTAAPRHDDGLASTSRRRALLKGIGKASALAGAAIPLQSVLASNKSPMRLTKGNGNTYLCSVSGNMSLLHSGTPVTTTCGGKKPSYYAVCTFKSDGTRTYTNWPAGCPVPTSSFNSYFQAGPSTSLGDLVRATSLTAEAHWVVALLNSYRNSSTFPYSALEIKGLYKSELNRGSTAALTFFTTYLEKESA